MDILVTVFLGIFIIYLVDYVLKPKIKVPVPKRIPFIGNAVFLKGKTHLLMEKWRKIYGDMFIVQSLRTNFLVVSGYKALHQVLFDNGKATAGRFRTYRANVILGKKDDNDLIFRSISPKWKKLRKFVHSKLKQYGEGMTRIQGIAQTISKELVYNIKDKSTEEGILDPYEWIYLAVVNSLSSMISGRKYDPDDPVFQTWMSMERLSIKHTSMREGMELDMFPWLRYFGHPQYKVLLQINKQIDDVYNILKQDYDKDPHDNTKSESLSFALFEELYSKKSDFLDEELVKNTMYDLLIAGTATTTASLNTFMLVMAHYQNIQEKLAAEILSVYSLKDSDGELELSDRELMPYTRACLLELQRYGAFVPSGLFHKTMSEVTITGVHIPKDTVVLTNLWSVLHDDRLWEDPYNFKPERFLNDDGSLISSDHDNRKRMLAFGLGPRMCLGQGLAQARMFIFVTSILRNFKIEKVSENKLHDARTFEFGVASTPEKCQLKFTPRLPQ